MALRENPEQLDLGFGPIRTRRPPPRAMQPYPVENPRVASSPQDGSFEALWSEKLQDHFQAWLTGADRVRKEIQLKSLDPEVRALRRLHEEGVAELAVL